MDAGGHTARRSCDNGGCATNGTADAFIGHVRGLDRGKSARWRRNSDNWDGKRAAAWSGARMYGRGGASLLRFREKVFQASRGLSRRSSESSRSSSALMRGLAKKPPARNPLLPGAKGGEAWRRKKGSDVQSLSGAAPRTRPPMPRGEIIAPRPRAKIHIQVQLAGQPRTRCRLRVVPTPGLRAARLPKAIRGALTMSS